MKELAKEYKNRLQKAIAVDFEVSNCGSSKSDEYEEIAKDVLSTQSEITDDEITRAMKEIDSSDRLTDELYFATLANNIANNRINDKLIELHNNNELVIQEYEGLCIGLFPEYVEEVR